MLVENNCNFGYVQLKIKSLYFYDIYVQALALMNVANQKGAFSIDLKMMATDFGKL